jgi:hypothetical protein
MTRIEQRALEHLKLKRQFDLYWWEFEENGKQNIIQEDLVVYSKLEGWLSDRDRMERDMEQQKMKSRLSKGGTS